MSSRYFFVFLLISFLISTGTSLYFVENQVESSVKELVEEYTQDSAKLTSSSVEQLFSTRMQIVSDLSIHPVLVSSAMGAANSLARLSDYLDSLTLLGKRESIAV